MNPHSFPKTVFQALLLILFCAGFIPSQPATPVNKNIAVVFLKLDRPEEPVYEGVRPIYKERFPLVIAPPRHTASIYSLMMNFKISPFIREATYNHSALHFDVILNPYSPDGWFDSPHPLKDGLVFQDAIGFAYAVLGDAIVYYDGLIVVQNIQSLYGYTAGCGFTEHGGYVTCPISAGPHNLDIILVSVGEQENDDSFYTVLGHELGHVHSLEHVTMGSYDNVGNSPVLTHYGGWSKVFASWADGVTDMPIAAGSYDLTTTLDPLNVPGNNVLRIPLFPSWGEDQFLGYFVECRVKSGFDVNIPEEGVIVTKINTFPGFEYAAHIVALTGDENYADAALAPGESYVDEDNEITITYLNQESGKRCTVKASRDEINAPDPWISLGSEVDSGKGYIEYSSRDIWIDSPQNGWDVYPAGYGLTEEGGEWHPTGYGDPFWANHENRIKFLIRNSGFSDAEHVFVDVYVTQPMILYRPCRDPRLNSGELIGTVEIDHLEKDGFYFGEVPWTSKGNAAAQVDVVIRDYVGEVSHVNNAASENYARQNILVDNIQNIATENLAAVFDGQSSVTLHTSLTCPERLPYNLVRKVISAIDKRDWVQEVGSMNGLLLPGEEVVVPLTGIPPEDAQPGDCEEVVFELKVMMDDYYVPVDGFTYQSCLVDPTELTCVSPLGTTLSGNTALVNGKLTPADGGEVVAMEYTSPSGVKSLQYVTVNPDGTYRDKILAREIGTWKLQAFWQGTDQRAPAESDICTLVVKEPTPTPTLIPTVTPSPCSQYTTEPTCIRRTQCKWTVDVTGKGACVMK